MTLVTMFIHTAGESSSLTIYPSPTFLITPKNQHLVKYTLSLLLYWKGVIIDMCGHLLVLELTKQDGKE